MTLNTRVRIERPLPAEEVFDFCLKLLSGGGTSEIERDPNPLYGYPHIWTSPGQGLPAWLTVEYGGDGPIPCPDWAHDVVDGLEKKHNCLPPAALVVYFDTGYGYNEDGAGCEDLHAWLITELGKWLDAQGIPWRWLNEYTGEWFVGYEGLGDFGDSEVGALR